MRCSKGSRWCATSSRYQSTSPRPRRQPRRFRHSRSLRSSRLWYVLGLGDHLDVDRLAPVPPALEEHWQVASARETTAWRAHTYPMPVVLLDRARRRLCWLQRAASTSSYSRSLLNVERRPIALESPCPLAVRRAGTLGRVVPLMIDDGAFKTLEHLIKVVVDREANGSCGFTFTRIKLSEP